MILCYNEFKLGKIVTRMLIKVDNHFCSYIIIISCEIQLVQGCQFSFAHICEMFMYDN